MMHATKRLFCAATTKPPPQLTLRGVPFCPDLAEQLRDHAFRLGLAAPQADAASRADDVDPRRVWLSRRECAALQLLVEVEASGGVATCVYERLSGCAHHYFNLGQHFPALSVGEVQLRLAQMEIAQQEHEALNMGARAARTGRLFRGNAKRLLDNTAVHRHFTSPYWATQSCLTAFQTQLLPNQAGVQLQAEGDTGVVKYYNAEQTEHPERFTRATCKEYFACSIYGDLYLRKMSSVLRGHLIEYQIPFEAFWMTSATCSKFGVRLAEGATPYFQDVGKDRQPIQLYNIAQCGWEGDVAKLRKMGRQALRRKMAKFREDEQKKRQNPDAAGAAELADALLLQGPSAPNEPAAFSRGLDASFSAPPCNDP